ncbi:MAG: carbohydrate ABC transporter permease, partial [Actinomycetota bacterium]
MTDQDYSYRESGGRLAVLALVTVPLLAGFAWLALSTFSTRTYGLVPVDDRGRAGGLTLDNWAFLWEDPLIWWVTLNTLLLALGLTIGVVATSAFAGYALSRLSFPGRKGFLATVLALHAFPSISLLISIYIVLR